MSRKRDLIQRWDGNPILTADSVPFRCNSVFNPAAVKFQDEYILMLRAELVEGQSVFALARSKDGLDFTVDPSPVMTPTLAEQLRAYEIKGIEDPRITQIGDEYFIMYTAYGEFGPCLALALTYDFEVFTRYGIISQPNNKDGCLFPRKIHGRYARLDRPTTNRRDIWISYSTDLIHWGDTKVVMTPRGGFWDEAGIGASVPPIETEHGWLEIYHGVKDTSAGPVYRLGAALLDLDDPSRVIGRSVVPVLSPRRDYERNGDVGNVVFSCGAILDPVSDMLTIYYGAGDTCVCAGIASLEDIIDSCILQEAEALCEDRVRPSWQDTYMLPAA